MQVFARSRQAWPALTPKLAWVDAPKKVPRDGTLPKSPAIEAKGHRYRRGLQALALYCCVAAVGCARPARVAEEAMLLSERGQTERALELLQAHLRERPEAVRERRLAIRLWGVTGNLARAEAEAAALAEVVGPKSPLPWLELGHAQELAHHFEAALALFDRAAAVAPLDAAGPRTGGLRAAAWGEVEWAEPRLAEAARRAPSDARVWHALGLVRVHLGELELAEQAYRRGIEVDARGLDNHIGLASVALVRGDAEAALTRYDIILRIEPRFADAELGRSWALIRLGRWVEAERALSRAEQLGAAPKSLRRQRDWLAAERSKSAGTR